MHARCAHHVAFCLLPSATCGGAAGLPKQLQLEPRAVRAQPLPPGVEASAEPLAVERCEDGDAQLHPAWLAAGRSARVASPTRRPDSHTCALPVQLKVELSRDDEALCRFLVGKPRKRDAKTPAVFRGMHAQLHRGAICSAGKLEQRIV